MTDYKIDDSRIEPLEKWMGNALFIDLIDDEGDKKYIGFMLQERYPLSLLVRDLKNLAEELEEMIE